MKKILQFFFELQLEMSVMFFETECTVYFIHFITIILYLLRHRWNRVHMEYNTKLD